MSEQSSSPQETPPAQTSALTNPTGPGLISRIAQMPDWDRNSSSRPDWDTYFMEIAFSVSARADCTRRKVGAVITRMHRIISTGYNGAPAFEPGCLSGACPRGRHYHKILNADPWNPTFECACGNPWPCPDSAKPGEGSYDDCISIHAEANAIIYGDFTQMRGGIMYCTEEPCKGCVKLIKAAHISKVVIP